MRVSARVEKSRSLVLGMTVTRGAGKEETPAVRVQRSKWPGLIKEGPEQAYG